MRISAHYYFIIHNNIDDLTDNEMIRASYVLFLCCCHKDLGWKVCRFGHSHSDNFFFLRGLELIQHRLNIVANWHYSPFQQNQYLLPEWSFIDNAQKIIEIVGIRLQFLNLSTRGRQLRFMYRIMSNMSLPICMPAQLISRQSTVQLKALF